MSYAPDVTFLADLPRHRPPTTDPLPGGWALLRADAIRTLSGRALGRRLAQLSRWEHTLCPPTSGRRAG